IPFEHFCWLCEPVEQLGLLAPESLRVALGALVHLAILVEGLDVRSPAEFFGRRNRFFLKNAWIELLHRSSSWQPTARRIRSAPCRVRRRRPAEAYVIEPRRI